MEWKVSVLDWLRRPPADLPTVEVGGHKLPVVVRRLPQARQMTLRLSPDGTQVRVSVPRWGGTAEALAFATSRIAWLEAQLDKVPGPAQLGQGSQIALGDEQLVIEHRPGAARRPRVADGQLIVGGPAEGLSRRLQRWLEAEARAAFSADLADYCAQSRLSVPALALSRAQRRWGSCARSGAIRLNWRLIMAPVAVRRAVVAHEVAHLVYFDHSPRFHALLGALFEGDIAAANDWLKRHGRELYAPFG